MVFVVVGVEKGLFSDHFERSTYDRRPFVCGCEEDRKRKKEEEGNICQDLHDEMMIITCLVIITNDATKLRIMKL